MSKNKYPLFRIPSLLSELQDAEANQGLTLYEENNNVIVEAAMPGLKKEEIEINLNRGVLSITGEKNEEETNEDRKFYKKSVRSFSYNMALPDLEETQEPQASYKDGILKISFQKAKATQGKRISISNGRKH